MRAISYSGSHSEGPFLFVDLTKWVLMLYIAGLIVRAISFSGTRSEGPFLFVDHTLKPQRHVLTSKSFGISHNFK